MEADGGKKSSKNWKMSMNIVNPDGTSGKTIKRWVEDHGYHPMGWTDSKADAGAKSKGRGKGTSGGDKSTAKGGKKKKGALGTGPGYKQKKSSSTAAAAAAVKEEKTPEKSTFEVHLGVLLDDDGGLKLAEKVPMFVWLMENAMKNREREIVVKVVHCTNKKCLQAFVSSDGFKVLKEWCEKAAADHKSSLLLKIIKTLKKLPMNLKALEATGFGLTVKSLRKYAPPGKKEAGSASTSHSSHCSSPIHVRSHQTRKASPRRVTRGGVDKKRKTKKPGPDELRRLLTTV